MRDRRICRGTVHSWRTNSHQKMSRVHRPFSSSSSSNSEGTSRSLGFYLLSSLAASVGVSVGAMAYFGGRESPTYWHLADFAATRVLCLLDPETAHGLTIALMRAGLAPRKSRKKAIKEEEEERKIDQFSPLSSTSLSKEEQEANLCSNLWGFSFASPLGLAAGFDKQAEVILPALGLGFGFVEVGGVTPLPQAGNPKPRMFRLPQDHAVINRFGFNSEGHEAAAPRMKKAREHLLSLRRKQSHGSLSSSSPSSPPPPPPPGVLLVNLAKNTGSASAVDDYRAGVRNLGPFADIIVLNVSCPNVKWTKDLKGDIIKEIVSAVMEERDKVFASSSHSSNGGDGDQEDGSLSSTRPPLLLKLSPDMTEGGKRHMATLALSLGVDGLIVGNTTSSRSPPLDLSKGGAEVGWRERGGLSGKPLRALSVGVIGDMYRLTVSMT